MARSDDPKTALQRRNDKIMRLCALLVLAMTGASFAAVPLYRAFCQATGFGGTTRVASAAPGATGGPLFTVRFDSNIDSALDWQFTPEQTALQVRPGEKGLAFYKATSRATAPTSGVAVYNVTPDLAGQYFSKIQCFCFNEQTLQAGQSVDMPVTFFVDPEILNDPDMKTVRTITLSYTFYPAAGPVPDAAGRAEPSSGGSSIRLGAAGIGPITNAN